MPSRRHTAALVVWAVLSTACSAAAVPETTLPTTTTSPPTTTSTTTTTAAPSPVAVAGDLPPQVLAAIRELYSWLADDRNPAPEVPRGMLRALTDSEHPVADSIAVTGVTRELEGGDSVAVAHVGDDTLFLVKDDEPWRIAGVMLAGLPPWLGSKPRLLLVLGSDAREGQNQQRLRADSIHIVGVDPTRSAASIVGFPRDAWVQGPAGGSKFTNVMANRGPEVMVETMADLTELELDGYVVTGFVGFEGLIEGLGGLVIDLPRAIRSGIDGWQDYPSGIQKLGPTAALRLARIRKTVPGGDFGRSANHGLMMVAGLMMVQEMGVDALPGLLELLLANAWTDLTTEELLTLGAAVYILTPQEMVNMVMPGSVGTAGGQSVVFLGRRAPEIYADLADGVIDEE